MIYDVFIVYMIFYWILKEKQMEDQYRISVMVAILTTTLHFPLWRHHERKIEYSESWEKNINQ